MEKRVISAVVALAITIPILYKGGLWFAIFGLGIAAVGFYELIKLILPNFTLLKLVSYVSFLVILVSNLYKTNLDTILDRNIIGILLLLFSIAMLYQHKEEDIVPKGLMTLAATLFLGTAFSALFIIYNIHILYFIYLFCISILTDTFAHSVGTIWGKHTVNEISPHKTWEGCLGGAFFGVLGSSIYYLIFIHSSISLLKLVTITFFLSCLGQLGDLFFSLIKRSYHIKDFGKIMPGHGGVLDRLDSVLFITLAFMFFIQFL